jgi:tRNA pseudouridine55 synthase
MAYPTDGILLIDKDEGEISYGVVRKVRRLLKVRKVGHAGTLDPFATGLLVILLGHGTKLSHFIMGEIKTYLATIRLGVETDTMDPTGGVIRTSVVPDLSPEYIQEKAQNFSGDIEQVPPAYSAVKHRGTRAYKLARRGVKVDLPKRMVTIHSMRILSVELPDIALEVSCSSGTYIRALASDLGRELGPGGHLRSLRRVASGSFEAKNALSSRELSVARGPSFVREKVIPLKAALPGMREIEVQGPLADKVRQGYQPAREELFPSARFFRGEDEYFKLVRHGELVAIVKIKSSEDLDHVALNIERVFS